MEISQLIILVAVLISIAILLTIYQFYLSKKSHVVLESFVITEDEQFAEKRYRVWVRRSDKLWAAIQTNTGETAFESLDKAKWVLKLYIREEAMLEERLFEHINSFGNIVWDAEKRIPEKSAEEVVRKLELENEFLQKQLQQMMTKKDNKIDM